jgi:pimeloyl-ACP methyl ester carboxylesterase
MQLLIFLFAFIPKILSLNFCYEGYGFNPSCFDAYFDLLYRPVVYTAQSPSIINTKFTLFTRNNRLSGARITANEPSVNYGAHKMTRFIVHGFMDDFNLLRWDDEMKDALPDVEDSNVIVVDWSGGNKFPFYIQAVANTQIVAAEIETLVYSYINKNLITADKIHIIGHSLGSHIAGYAGTRLRNKGHALGRITGLDPAGPLFENTNAAVRLDPTDALFVDAIHVYIYNQNNYYYLDLVIYIYFYYRRMV